MNRIWIRFFQIGLTTLLLLLSILPTLGAGDTAVQEYRIKPGDTLDIEVSGEPAYSGAFVVGASGDVFFGGGISEMIKVEGFSLPEAKVNITTKLAEYIKNPVISIRISKFRIPVSGEIEKPGSYEMTAGETVADVISRAGGVKRELVLTMVELHRASGAILQLQSQGEYSLSTLLQPGDEVLVGRSESGESYKVSGAVKTPGTFPLSSTEPTRISQAITAAGGWNEDADPQKAILVRANGIQVNVNLMELDTLPGDSLNLPMQAGDELFIPRKGIRIIIQGGVLHPGEYLVEEGTTFFGALGKAGGPNSGAKLNDCRLMHTKPKSEWMAVKLDDFLKKGVLKADPEVRDGDLLWVPQTDPRSRNRDFLDYLNPFIWIFR